MVRADSLLDNPDMYLWAETRLRSYDRAFATSEAQLIFSRLKNSRFSSSSLEFIFLNKTAMHNMSSLVIFS